MILERYYIECLSHASYLIGDETTGRAWKSISVLVREHPGAEPTAVLTGDCLFIGDVGRPDLVNVGDSSTTDLARAMYHSIHDKLLRLPDSVTVMPAHGAGSSCGKNLSSDLTSTIGEQRRTNPSVQPMSEHEFVELITHGQPAAPAYFAVDAAINKRVHPLLDQARTIPALSPAQIRAALDGGIRVLDTRSVDEFAAGHLRGSVNVGFDGRFAETAGMVAEVGEKIALISHPGQEQSAAMRLARIGSDNAIGYLNVDHDGAFPAKLADLVQATPRVTAAELERLLAGDAVTLIDIRNSAELDNGTIPGAIHIPLAHLRARFGELPIDRPIVVCCRGGWRSSAAASLLRVRGFRRVADLAGDYTQWAQHPAVESPTAQYV